MNPRVWLRDMAFTSTILRKRPFQVLVQVTNRCNMRCSFCDFWPNPAARTEELTVAEFDRISDELSGLGCFLVSVEGGEPLARPDLPEIVRAFAKHHIPALFTNGWMVTPEIAASLFAAGLVHASVSIDYPDGERHDAKRGLAGATERAWRAVEMFRAAAPRGGKQVHVMTVLMESNWRDAERLFQQSAAAGVGHQVTLLSVNGFRRGEGPDRLPPREAAASLAGLWDRYPHVRMFREYFDRIGDFVSDGSMPPCRAGLQSFNIDHVGNVSPCIEKIDRVAGNVREATLAEIHRRLERDHAAIAACQDCWTACRGFNQALGDGGTLAGWRDMTLRMRTT